MDEYIKREDALKAIAYIGTAPPTDIIPLTLYTAQKKIRKIPTADVVAKSEVEKIIGKFECFLCHVTGSRLSKHTYDLRTMETVATDCINETYNDGYGEGYKDCAREIFEEIECFIETSSLCSLDQQEVLDYIAELKKKYTEEQQ